MISTNKIFVLANRTSVCVPFPKQKHVHVLALPENKWLSPGKAVNTYDFNKKAFRLCNYTCCSF